MKGQKTLCAGFVGRNSGVVRDCLAEAKVRGGGMNAGFAAKNTNKISNCLFRGKKRTGRSRSENTSVFCAEDEGRIRDSYYILNGGAIKGYLADPGKDVAPSEVNLTNEVWIHDGGNITIDRSALYERKTPRTTCADEPVTITTAKQLCELAEKINSGDAAAAKSYRLGRDIDMRGVSWTPIGTAMETPFMGHFDGAGHKVYNFKIKNENAQYAGFFGVAKNAVITNLSVDCTVKGAPNCAALVGYNDGGEIHNCHATASVSGKQVSSGLVAVNNGTITGSSFSGVIKPLDLYPASVPLAFLALFLVGLFSYGAMFWSPKDIYYATIPREPGAELIPGEQITPPEDGKHQASFSFDKIIIFDGKTGSFNFKNPGISDQVITIEVQITDEVLIKQIGKTGRTKKDREAIEMAPEYDPAKSRMTIAQTLGIEPAMQLKNLTLKQFPDGSYLPRGEYKGIVRLQFYDMETGFRSVADAELQVMIIVR